jgi:hypothetical protein
LYLRISPAGGRRWVLRIQMHHTQRHYHRRRWHISLKNARLEAAALRAQVAKGGGPAEERRKARKGPSVRGGSPAGPCRDVQGLEKRQAPATVDRDLGTLCLSQAGQAHSRQDRWADDPRCLAEIWLDIPETARRVRQRIGAVLDWCYAKGLRDSEAPMRSLARGLPRQPKRMGHFAALPISRSRPFSTPCAPSR